VEVASALWRVYPGVYRAPAAGLLLVGCTLLALLEIFRRYLFGVSFEWQQDAVTFFTLSGIFLYFGISQRHNAHLSVTVLPEVLDVFGPGARRAAELVRLVALLLSFVFMLAVVWWGIPEVRESVHYESRTESLAFPMWPFLAALLAGFAFMAVSMFFQIYRAVQKLRGRSVLEEPPEQDAALH
jgi:TRAP-type C4-dicarboxylate transport system permease small subunit